MLTRLDTKGVANFPQGFQAICFLSPQIFVFQQQQTWYDLDINIFQNTKFSQGISPIG